MRSRSPLSHSIPLSHYLALCVRGSSAVQSSSASASALPTATATAAEREREQQPPLRALASQVQCWAKLQRGEFCCWVEFTNGKTHLIAGILVAVPARLFVPLPGVRILVVKSHLREGQVTAAAAWTLHCTEREREREIERKVGLRRPPTYAVCCQIVSLASYSAPRSNCSKCSSLPPDSRTLWSFM